MLFPIGTRVGLSQQGRDRWGTSPAQGGGGGGVVDDHYSGTYLGSQRYGVEWDNGLHNSYRDGDLVQLQRMRIEGNELILEQ